MPNPAQSNLPYSWSADFVADQPQHAASPRVPANLDAHNHLAPAILHRARPRFGSSISSCGDKCIVKAAFSNRKSLPINSVTDVTFCNRLCNRFSC